MCYPFAADICCIHLLQTLRGPFRHLSGTAVFDSLDSFFSLLFVMRMIIPDIDFKGLIDFHCHILPGIDDGSRDMDESLRMIGLSYAQGFRGFIATSHYSRRHPLTDFPERTAGLREAVHAIYNDVEIFDGQETRFHEELTERLGNGLAFRLGGSSYVLVEFDVDDGFDMLFRGLRSILSAGCRPVLAHVERYACLRDASRIEELRSMGVVIQMNYECLVGGFFDRDVSRCRRLILSGLADVLGSDMHRTDYRPPDTLPAQRWLRKAVSDEHFDLLTRLNALHILRDEDIE